MKQQARQSSISTRGRITIPADLRKRLGFNSGTHVDWSKQDGRLILTNTATDAKNAKPVGARRKKLLVTGR
jgi:AbrB family looped-hinge helix DNA binding protein